MTEKGGNDRRRAQGEGGLLKLGDTPRSFTGSIVHLFLSDLPSMKRNDSCAFLSRAMRWGANLRDRSLLFSLAN